jgi:LPS sulfotransferase NodH
LVTWERITQFYHYLNEYDLSTVRRVVEETHYLDLDREGKIVETVGYTRPFWLELVDQKVDLAIAINTHNHYNAELILTWFEKNTNLRI